ncbi:MAG: type I 3-dehydroquinate dehydratase [Candidatus Helarchaeales archaeon]
MAIAAKNTSDARKKMKKAVKLGATHVEIRVDYFESIVPSALKEIIEECPVPVILTLRKQAEGGLFKGSEDERRDMLKTLIQLSPAHVDVELSTESLPELLSLARKNSVEVICSWHDFQKTPPLNELLSKIEATREKGGRIAKIITMANDLGDNLIHFNLLRSITDLKLICFAMGQQGLLSRVFSPFFGSIFTFASIDELTAPGQIHISKMKKIHELMNLT